MELVAPGPRFREASSFSARRRYQRRGSISPDKLARTLTSAAK